MRIIFALVAAGAFLVSGCKTTESATAEPHKIFVKVDRVVEESEPGSANRHVSIVVERDGEETIHIEGDPLSAEVQEQLAQLKSEGIHLIDEDHAFLSEDADGKKHKWVMRYRDEHEHDGANLHLDEEERVFILKGGDQKEHQKRHKKVIVIKGDAEEDIREQLKEHGFDLEFDLDLDDDESDEETEK